jgi:hypothetical protein
MSETLKSLLVTKIVFTSVISCETSVTSSRLRGAASEKTAVSRMHFFEDVYYVCVQQMSAKATEMN